MGKADDKKTSDGAPAFPIVGIGASAGGLKAAARLLEHTPADSGMAFVLVFHLDPEHKSEAAELLQVHTDIPVVQIQGNTRVEPNHVYVIPPGHGLKLVDGGLTLVDSDRTAGRPTVIDRFFRSLAEHAGERAIGIVLSGTGTEGGQGLKAIKEAGGITVVQDENEAEYSGMPHSAITTGMVDFVLPVAEMAAKLLKVKDFAVDFALPAGDRPAGESDAEILQKIFVQLRTQVGSDFSHYKQNTVLRRIARRMQVHAVKGLDEYLNLLRNDPKETESLFRELLISVTNFFRDPDAMAALEGDVVPQLCKRAQGQTVRVWVPGCATGEEAYSLAMLLSEACDELASPPRLQIFASDVDDRALEVARRGLYPDAIAGDVSETRLKRFFERDGNGYLVKGFVREMILFTRHDLLGDPPFSKLDLISCRNVLIYLKNDIQAKVFNLFHFALKREGWLFLGGSESLGNSGKLFTEIDRKAKLFQARRVPGGEFRVPLLPVSPREMTKRRERDTGDKSFAELARDELLGRYAPPCVIVDENYDAVYISGRVGKFLEPGSGESNYNVLDMAREGLRLELRAALYRALHGGEATHGKALRVRVNSHEELMALTVQPLAQADGHLLVIFEELEAGAAVPEPARADGDESMITQLEAELTNTRESLQTSIEELETSNEELRASNEELQSMNEELQSTTEELETGKEELQSANEELLAVNQELQGKNDELARANSDLNNFIASNDIGTLFLDPELNVRRYTPRMADIFNLIPGDVGRPLAHLTSNLVGGDLINDATRVMTNLAPIEQEFGATSGRHYQVRMRPYRDGDNKIGGVVLTFVDITAIRDAETARRESEARLALAIEIGNIGHWSLDLATRVLTTSPACRRNFGRAAGAAFTYEDMLASIHPDDHARYAQAVVAAIDGRAALQIGCRIHTASGEVRQVEVRARFDAGADHDRLIGVSLDVTAAKQLEAGLRESRQQLGDELAKVEALQGISSELVTEDRAEDFFPKLLDAAMVLMHADFASVQALDDDGMHLRMLASRHLHPQSVAYWGSVERDGATACARALAAGTRVIVPDVETCDFMAATRDLEEFRRSGVRAVQATPLLARDGRMLGVLSTHWRSVHTSPDDDFRLFDTLVRQVADLFDRNEVEARVRASEQRFRALVTTTSEAIYQASADWSELIDLRGGGFLADCAALPDWMSTYVPGEERPRLRIAIDAAIRAKDVFELEHRVICADGTIGWAASRAVPILDDRGRIRHWFGAATDVTERRRRERAQLEQTRLLEMVVSGAALDEVLTALCAGLMRLDPDLRVAVVLANEARSAIERVLTSNLPAALGEALAGASIDAAGLGPIGAAFGEGTVVACADVAHDLRWSAQWRDPCEAHDVRACHATPVRDAERVVRSVLLVCFEHPHEMLPWEQRLAEFGAHVAGIAIQRERAERALRQSELKYRSLFDTMDDGFCIIEMIFDADDKPVDYRYVETNAAFVKHATRPMLGKRIKEIAPDFEQTWLDHYGEVARTGQPVRLEGVVHGLDDQWFQTSAVRVGGEGTNRVAVLFRNITTRRRAERAAEQLASIVDTTDDAVISKDLDGNIVSWNAAAEAMFGYTATEAIGTSITDLIVPADRMDEEADILRRIARRETIDHFETVRRRKDGSTLDVSVTISPLTVGGRVVGASKIARDITERKRHESHRDLLIHELNHRVKNTLATVQALATQTFHDDGSKNSVAAFVARLLALSAAHDVLTRADWGGADIHEIVRDVLAAWSGAATTRIRVDGPELKLSPPAALALAMALHELATNAVKYGALVDDDGHVALDWRIDGVDAAPRFEMLWSEHDGPPVHAPSRRGFGSRLIEQGLARDLGGTAKISFEPDGVRCRIEAPLAEVVAMRGGGMTHDYG